MAANPISIEDLIARAVEAGEIVEGINDPKTLLERSKANSKALLGLLATSSPMMKAEIQRSLEREAAKQAAIEEMLESDISGVFSAKPLSAQPLPLPEWEPSPEVELIAKALQIAGSPERLAEWIRTPVPALNGQTPYSLMHTEDGRKQVEDILGRIEHG